MEKYNIGWSTKHPGLLIYLVDLSGSMQWDDKIDRVRKILWDVLDHTIEPSQTAGNIYLDNFEVKVIGYNQYTYNIFSGNVNAINQYLDKTGDDMMLFDASGDFRPRGLTHTAMAFDKVREEVSAWIQRQRAANAPIPAPVVLHITDGHPEEKETPDAMAYQHARDAAKRLLDLKGDDGNLILFNMHIDVKPGQGTPMYFPTACPSDERRKFLYEISSPMESVFVKRGGSLREAAPKEGSRFMVSNVSSPSLLAELIKFGSSVSSKNTQRETPID